MKCDEPFSLRAARDFRSSQISSGDNRYRYQLSRWWCDEPDWVVWLMLNPSTATPYHDDPTTRRLTHFTQAWGYTGWIAINLYPLRASNPDQLWPWTRWQENGPDWHARDAMQANLRHIEGASRKAKLRIVAFGREPMRRDWPWIEQCLEQFRQPFNYGHDEQLYCLGVAKGCAPLHPMARGRLRVPDSMRPMLWTRASSFAASNEGEKQEVEAIA